MCNWTQVCFLTFIDHVVDQGENIGESVCGREKAAGCVEERDESYGIWGMGNNSNLSLGDFARVTGHGAP